MILDDIVADKRARLLEHKREISLQEMKEQAEKSTRVSYSFLEALKKDGLSIIGEFKKASPSMGVITSKVDLIDRIDQYNQSVDAISVLTEQDHFNGGKEYLEQIRGISNLPIIRKDFIIDEYQIYEAKVIGADAILLIAAILKDEQMRQFYELAYRLGLFVLLEVHDETEMLRALQLGAQIIGVNNRDLRDFTIHLETTKRLSEYMDSHLDIWKSKNPNEKRPVFVSESGVTKSEHISFLKEAKVDALLIGRAFMEAEQPLALAKQWKGEYQNA